VRSDVSDLLGLRQDLEQLVVGEEVEPSEHRSLLLKIVGQPLLHNLEVLVGLLELLLESFLGAD